MQWKNCSLLSTILRKHVTGSDKSLISRLVVSNIRYEEIDLNLGICLTEHADLTANFLVNTCFNKFRNIYRKTTASEPLSVKLQTSRHTPMSIMGLEMLVFRKSWSDWVFRNEIALVKLLSAYILIQLSHFDVSFLFYCVHSNKTDFRLKFSELIGSLFKNLQLE